MGNMCLNGAKRALKRIQKRVNTNILQTKEILVRWLTVFARDVAKFIGTGIVFKATLVILPSFIFNRAFLGTFYLRGNMALLGT